MAGVGRIPLNPLRRSIYRGLTWRSFLKADFTGRSDELSEKPVDAVPDIRLSAERVQREVRKYYQDLGMPVSPQASDFAGLTESMRAGAKLGHSAPRERCSAAE